MTDRATELPDSDRVIAAAELDASVAPIAHPRMVLATTILASSLAFIDGSVVNVGLPAIGQSLAASGEALSWIVNAYLLPLSALLLVGGAAGDVFGRRRLLILGVALFAIASALCAVAPGLPWLIAGRVLQGTGAALLMPNSLAILGASFGGEARGRAIGTWAAVGAAAGALGPLLGGWIIDLVGWRAIFLVNLPLAAGAIFLAARYVRDDRADRRRPLDFAGATLAAAALTALTWGLTAASASQGFSLGVLVSLAAGTLLGAAFLWVEHDREQAAMMPLALFASASFVGLTLLTFLLYGALTALLVLVPYVLIEVGGYTATEAGAALLPLPLMIALASRWMGHIAGRIGPRLLLTIGPMIVAMGFLLARHIGGPGNYWTSTLPAMLVVSLGMAGTVAPLTTAVLSSVGREHTGIASGLNSAVARTGGLIATAVVSVVLAAHGSALLSYFHVAVVVGAIAAAASGLCAFAWVRGSVPLIRLTR